MSDNSNASDLAVAQLQLERERHKADMRAFGDERYTAGMADAYRLALETGWAPPDRARADIQRMLDTAAHNSETTRFGEFVIYNYPDPRST